MSVKSKRLQVAVIGRPNVGKSTLFNQLTGTRKAIVRDEPGVTRDIHQGKSDWCGVTFDLYDTGGITEGQEKVWNQKIKEQALKAAAAADKIILVLDGKYGLNPEDRDLAIRVKTLNKPVLAVVNKIDLPKNFELALSEFYILGYHDMVAASFEHKHNLDVILDWTVKDQERNMEDLATKAVKLAIVGKPNAGKSTLVNSFLNEERVVVSPIAGTTVDSIEVPFWRGDKEYVLIDTAGLRRRAKRLDQVEQLSAIKTQDTVRMSDVLVLVIDGLDGPSVQDARIVELALENHKAVILAINKVDIAQNQVPEFRKKLTQQTADVFHFFRDIPMVFISAKTKKGIPELFDMIEHVWKCLNFKVSTRVINDFFLEVIKQAPAPSFRGNDIKFFYITQTGQKPPSFMTFVNEPKGLNNGYRRFVINKIKEHFKLKGIPVRLYAKKRMRTRTNIKIEESLKDGAMPRLSGKNMKTLKKNSAGDFDGGFEGDFSDDYGDMN